MKSSFKQPNFSLLLKSEDETIATILIPVGEGVDLTDKIELAAREHYCADSAIMADNDLPLITIELANLERHEFDIKIVEDDDDDENFEVYTFTVELVVVY